MGRKLETAHISFGLVTIPVGIYTAIDEQDIHFNQLHGPCGSRIKQQRFCPVCKRDVNYDELVKGYEISKEAVCADQPGRIGPITSGRVRCHADLGIRSLERRRSHLF